MNPAQLINYWLSSPKPSVYFAAIENECFIQGALPEVWRMKEFVKSRDELINTFCEILKISPSPQTGEMIEHLKNEIVEGRLLNDRNVIVEYLAKLMKRE